MVEVLEGERARVDSGGVRQEVSPVLVGAVTPGGYLVVHVGFALGRMDADKADATLARLAAESLETAR